MALIKCPECGNSISDTVEQCIHCGCKITACPECGAVMVGTINVCSDCGAVLRNEAKKEKEEPKAKEKSTVREIATQWAAETKSKVVKRRPLVIIAFLLCVASIGILWAWKTGDPLAAFARYTVVKYGTIAISIISAVLYFISLYLKKNEDYISKVGFLSYLKNNGTDGKTFIKDYADTGIVGKTTDLVRNERLAATTALYSLMIKDDSKYNNSYQQYVKLYCILSFVVHSIIEVFFVKNIIGFMEHALFETGTYFDSFQLLWLIPVAAGFWAVRCILSLIYTRKFDKVSKKWFEKHMPEYEEKYNKRIFESITYIP